MLLNHHPTSDHSLQSSARLSLKRLISLQIYSLLSLTTLLSFFFFFSVAQVVPNFLTHLKNGDFILWQSFFRSSRIIVGGHFIMVEKASLQFLGILKEAVCFPLLKRTDLAVIFSNLRLISNLMYSSKLTKKAVFQQLNGHLTNNCLSVYNASSPPTERKC